MYSFDLNFIVLFSIIILLSTIQSILGVGLLIFGTPTLLLLGYSYEYVLSIILPCSIVISFIQSFKKNNIIGKKNLYFYTIPCVALGLIIIINGNLKINIIKYIGAILFLIAIIRTNYYINKIFKSFVKKFTIFYCIFLGFIHGLFNMSGAFLAIYMTSVNDSSKDIRISIAYWYLIFAIIQLFVLLFTNNFYFSDLTIYLVLISGFCCLIVNKLFLKKINYYIFQSITTFAIFIYAIICLVF